MTTYHRKQIGSAHVVIVSVLMIALLGALGFVFWQNFITKNSKVEPVTQPNAKTDVSPRETTYNTYQTDKHPISFQYPSSWSLGGAEAGDDEDIFTRSINVTTDTNDKVSFFVGGQGLGGTCNDDTLSTYTTLETIPTTFKATKPVTFSFTLLTKPDGTLEGHYGLTDTYTTLSSGDVCLFYYIFKPTNEVYSLMGFSGLKDFKDIADAKKYIASVEYAAIKKMILSLNY